MLEIFFKKKVVRKKTSKKSFRKVIKIRKVSDLDKTEIENLRKRILERLNYFKSFYYEKGIDMNFNRVTIRNQKTRWGSCSSKKNLNFNVHMKNLNEDLFDYVIAHEMCHLIHMNHSKDFWDLLKVALPNCVERKSKLRMIVI